MPMIDIGAHGGAFGGNSKKVLSIEKVATYSSPYSLLNNKILYKNEVVYGMGPNSNEFSRTRLGSETKSSRTIDPVSDYLMDGDYIFVLCKGAYLYKFATNLLLDIIAQVPFGQSDRLVLGNNYLYALEASNRKIHKIDKNTLSILDTVTIPSVPLIYGNNSNVSFVVDEHAGIAAYRDTSYYIRVVSLSDGSSLASFNTAGSSTLIGLFFTRVDGILFLNVLIQDGSYLARFYRYRMTDFAIVLNDVYLDPRPMSGNMNGMCRLYGDIFLTIDSGYPIVIYPSVGTLNYSRVTREGTAHQIATDGPKIITYDANYVRYYSYELKWR